MSEWESIVWFDESDIGGTSKFGTNTGGSGSTPGIDLSNDYSIYSESGAALMTESGDLILMET